MYTEARKYVPQQGGKNQSVETHTKIQITELAGKDIEMVTITMADILKKLKNIEHVK